MIMPSACAAVCSSRREWFLLYYQGMAFQRSILACMLLGWCGFTARGDDKQEWLQDELYRACYDGVLDKVKKLLSEGASAKLMSEGYQELPLNRAISMGHEDLVKLLVAHGAPLSDPEASALAVAARGVSFPYSEMKTKRMIDLLLSLGADVHVYDEEAVTEAAGTGLAIVQQLEKAGGKPNRRALVRAVRGCHLDIVEHLIQEGIDPTSTDDEGRTLLHEAADAASAYSQCEPEERIALWNRLLALGIPVDALDRRGRSPLFEAGTEEMMEWLVEKKANVNLKDREGMTVLMEVAGDGWDTGELMRWLLKAGADLTAKDQKGRSALDFAAEAEAWGEVSLLLDEGAVAEHAVQILTAMAHATLDHATPHEHVAGITAHLLPKVAEPNALRVDGLSLLSWAVLINSPAVAKLLLKTGVETNAVDAEGRTPLMLAALAGNTAMRGILLKAGADSSLKNKQGLTADRLTPFPSMANDILASGLTDGSSVLVPPAQKDDIFGAIAADQIDEVKRLVGTNAAVLVQRRGGMQPLHLAIALGLLPMVEWLVKNGAALTAKTSDQQSCLTIALQANQPEVARWLMKEQDVSDHAVMMEDLNRGWAELPKWSEKEGNVLALRLALEAGWKPDGDEKARDAVELAIRSDDSALAQQLLSLGALLTPREKDNADPFMQGPSHENLIRLATEQRDTAMLKFLLEKISTQRAAWREDITEALHFAASSGNLPAVKLLVEQGGADVNEGTRKYHGIGSEIRSQGNTVLFTPICLAVEQSHREIVDYLLQKGAKTAGNDHAGRQVLASAVATGKIELVRLMLDHGAALEAKNDDGGTALHEAAGRGLSDIAELLLSKGASREAKDSSDRTPAQLAESLGQTFP